MEFKEMKEKYFGKDINYIKEGIQKEDSFFKTDIDMIKLCIEDKFNIPSNYRDKVVEMEGKKIISEYVETNEYYRMIAGLPRLGEDYIFLDTEDLATYGIYEEETEDFEKRTPLHELPGDVLTAMETNGYLAKLQELYPDQKYISYLNLIWTEKHYHLEFHLII